MWLGTLSKMILLVEKCFAHSKQPDWGILTVLVLQRKSLSFNINVNKVEAAAEFQISRP